MKTVAVVIASAALFTASLGAASLNTAGALPDPAIGGQGNRDGLESAVGFLASDATQGRDNDTPGSTLAQNYLISQLKQFAIGANTAATGDAAFKQSIPGGTNIIGMIRGTTDEAVVVGAHFDHLGSNCRTNDPNDHICNGATDNAASDAEVLSIGREIAQQPGAPRRTVILAFWDREEDGLLGSQFYVNNPLAPIARTVGYVNFDIQGSNLLPSLRRDTFAVGAESGGAALQSIVRSAGQRGPVAVHRLSSIFGEGRSDYVNFIGKGVPTVFFSDSTSGCYHTAQDEIGVVDFWKLGFQAKTGLDTVQALIGGPRVSFVGNTPLATYDDAVALLPVVNKSVADQDLIPVVPGQDPMKFHDDVNRIVADGPANFGNDDVTTLLTDAANAINATTTVACNGFLKPGH